MPATVTVLENVVDLCSRAAAELHCVGEAASMIGIDAIRNLALDLLLKKPSGSVSPVSPMRHDAEDFPAWRVNTNATIMGGVDDLLH